LTSALSLNAQQMESDRFTRKKRPRVSNKSEKVKLSITGLAHAPVLRLPCIEVHEGCKRLTENSERDPENDVSDQLAALTQLHLLQRRSDGNKWQLEKHAQERNAYDRLVLQKGDLSPYQHLPIILCVGTPTKISCSTADMKNTAKLANCGLQPRPTIGIYTWRLK
jgi:hypothetical protein